MGDIISCGNKKFMAYTGKIEETFEVKGRNYHSFEFEGVSIVKSEYGYLANQSAYASSLRELANEATNATLGR